MKYRVVKQTELEWWVWCDGVADADTGVVAKLYSERNACMVCAMFNFMDV